MKYKLLVIGFVIGTAGTLMSCTYSVSNAHLEPSYVCEGEEITPVGTWDYEGNSATVKIKNKDGEVLCEAGAHDEICNFERPLMQNDLVNGKELEIWAKGKKRANFHYLVLSGERGTERFETNYIFTTETGVAVDDITMPDGTVIHRGREYTIYKSNNVYANLKSGWFSKRVRTVGFKVLLPLGVLNPPPFTVSGPGVLDETIRILPGLKYDGNNQFPAGKWEIKTMYDLNSLFSYYEGSLGPADTYKLELFIICEE